MARFAILSRLSGGSSDSGSASMQLFAISDMNAAKRSGLNTMVAKGIPRRSSGIARHVSCFFVEVFSKVRKSKWMPRNSAAHSSKKSDVLGSRVPCSQRTMIRGQAITPSARHHCGR